MPSPSIVPEAAPIDHQHLQRMTLGDEALEREVLALFIAQAKGLIARLTEWPDDAAALAHKLKGSARGIGAFTVADAASELETVLTHGGDASLALWALDLAVKAASEAIGERLKRC
ncbi:HPt (histidine-containing phosphotransfer) domain-containing protein [Rhodopseudomonas rhenobacensis]|uniref:HPt (Histidine-containing phosphotransfer) domain-containing protein n=1 Tax=Rhodopseudomonas rhenobacensis TaxID=87461 RepID=A0A7W8E061_9BRAD|nr:Hpt domain-containing protein [Rhodopseudomonas rhenobacensis]MBB5047571.1 HPt (histidine-containing phosphotransfer) domain-containing protein [Rhodopseudomonas rhenobacensis]